MRSEYLLSNSLPILHSDFVLNLVPIYNTASVPTLGRSVRRDSVLYSVPNSSSDSALYYVTIFRSSVVLLFALFLIRFGSKPCTQADSNYIT